MQMQQAQQENESSSDEDDLDLHPDFEDLEYDIDRGSVHFGSNQESENDSLNEGFVNRFEDDAQGLVQDNEIMDIDGDSQFIDDDEEEVEDDLQND